jgi:hypothetical protein
MAKLWGKHAIRLKLEQKGARLADSPIHARITFQIGNLRLEIEKWPSGLRYAYWRLGSWVEVDGIDALAIYIQRFQF